jgi:hypothetical protein
MSTYEAWFWARLIEALDRAGYAIVKKPEILGRGGPR